jgi:hypothetical protein
MTTPPLTALWRRHDLTGLDAVRLERRHHGWTLDGTVIVEAAGRVARLDYDVRCDDGWRTRRVHVTGWIGAESVHIVLDCDGAGHWKRDGIDQPQLDGCVDVDLAFTPATNTLPLRRLALPVGAIAPVRAAWLRFPGLTLEVLEQVYARTGDRSYRYESDGGRFGATLEVTGECLVERYGEYWTMEAIGRGGASHPGDG